MQGLKEYIEDKLATQDYPGWLQEHKDLAAQLDLQLTITEERTD